MVSNLNLTPLSVQMRGLLAVPVKEDTHIRAGKIKKSLPFGKSRHHPFARISESFMKFYLFSKDYLPGLLVDNQAGRPVYSIGK
jgi:hypothetical protein